MSRWRVSIHQSRHNGAKNPKSRWVVDPPGYNHENRGKGGNPWQLAGGKSFAWGSGTTKRDAWEKAIAYADRKARTVEVTLPRLRPQGEVTVSAVWDYDTHSINYINAAEDIAQGTPADLRPLAVTLLALAEKEGA